MVRRETWREGTLTMLSKAWAAHSDRPPPGAARHPPAPSPLASRWHPAPLQCPAITSSTWAKVVGGLSGGGGGGWTPDSTVSMAK